jgi:hypothetical protein
VVLGTVWMEPAVALLEEALLGFLVELFRRG